jgi:hypothetical protein
VIPSIPYYSYNGNAVENVAATFDNSLIHAGNNAISLANSISVGAQYTWNNGLGAYLNTQVDATRQFVANTWSGIQNTFNYVTTTPNAQQWKDLGNYLSNPDNIAKLGAAAIEAYAMGKITNAVTGSTVSSATTKAVTTTRTPLTSEISASSGNPENILFDGGRLSNSQANILETLPNAGNSTIVPKRSVSVRDLSALTAQTGDEFAMFTTGGRRLIVRGTQTSVPINTEAAKELASKGWRWSAHTHPGITNAGLRASTGDVSVLQQFTRQTQSLISNSVGNVRRFVNDHFLNFLN